MSPLSTKLFVCLMDFSGESSVFPVSDRSGSRCVQVCLSVTYLDLFWSWKLGAPFNLGFSV